MEHIPGLFTRSHWMPPSGECMEVITSLLQTHHISSFCSSSFSWHWPYHCCRCPHPTETERGGGDWRIGCRQGGALLVPTVLRLVPQDWPLTSSKQGAHTTEFQKEGAQMINHRRRRCGHNELHRASSHHTRGVGKMMCCPLFIVAEDSQTQTTWRRSKKNCGKIGRVLF